MKKKISIILFSVIMIIVYIVEVVNLFFLLSHNLEYYKFLNYGEEIITYYSTYPVYYLGLWLLNLICGLMAPILFLFNDKYTKGVSFTSFLSNLLLIVLTCVLNNRIRVLGFISLLIDIIVLLLTLVYVVSMFKYYNVDKKK